MLTEKLSLVKKIAIAGLPILLGGLIYLTYRAETLVMFSWFEQIGANGFVVFLRGNPFLLGLALPAWVKYSLPDALWVFSFTYIMLLIWKFKPNARNLFWILVAPTIGIFSELGQVFGLINGTFDPIDLLVVCLAAILPFYSIFISTFKLKQDEKFQHN